MKPTWTNYGWFLTIWKANGFARRVKVRPFKDIDEVLNTKRTRTKP